MESSLHLSGMERRETGADCKELLERKNEQEKRTCSAAIQKGGGATHAQTITAAAVLEAEAAQQSVALCVARYWARWACA